MGLGHRAPCPGSWGPDHGWPPTPFAVSGKGPFPPAHSGGALGWNLAALTLQGAGPPRIGPACRGHSWTVIVGWGLFERALAALALQGTRPPRTGDACLGRSRTVIVGRGRLGGHGGVGL